MTITVEILQDHIDAGVPANCHLCPVAMALQQATGEAWGVKYDSLIRIRDYLRVPMPATVAAFIRRFDVGRACKPLSFTVEVPS